MPSRAAHRHALRRSKEPGVIAPEGIELPALPARAGWRNPVVGDYHDRDTWEAFNVTPGGSITHARVQRTAAGFAVTKIAPGVGAMAVMHQDAIAAFSDAAAWAIARIAG